MIHAWSGSNTVSATFGHGKGVLLEEGTEMDDAGNLVHIFMGGSVSSAEVAEAGAKLFVLYVQWTTRRHIAYFSIGTMSTMLRHQIILIRLEVLPPTE